MAKILILYVGTRRLAGVVAEPTPEASRILRFTQIEHPAGFQKGEVVQLDKAMQSLEEILKRLELGEEVSKVPTYGLLSHVPLKMSRFSSSIYYGGYPRPITPQEIRRVVDQTKSVAPLPLEDWVLQLVPESFWVNDLKGVSNPLGLDAQRLAVTLQIFTTAYGSFRNLSRLFESLELNVQGFFPKTLVLPDGVLMPAEKEGEALILDISEDVTHLVLTQEGRIVQTRSLDLGSQLLTRRVAETWKLGVRDAEVLKERFGSFEENPQFGEELIPLVERNGHKNHQIKRAEFHEAFLGFGEEFFSRLKEEMTHFLSQENAAFPHFVVTGGSVKLDGFLDFLSRCFSTQVRLGTPRLTEGAAEFLMDPGWAGVAGLLRWLERGEDFKLPLQAKENLLERTFGQVKDWLAAYF